MEREDLKELAKQYFADPSRPNIFGTEDRHFFDTELLAIRHCKGHGRLYWEFTREEFYPKSVKKDERTPKQKLQDEATELGIEFDESTTSKQLKALIADKKED